MTIRRFGRRFVAAGIMACALVATGQPQAQAQGYPTRTIKMVIAFPPGGPTDFVGRLLADKFKELLGQSVIIENKAGANGAIGADAVAKADPDGYTLFFTTVGAVAITPNLRNDMPYDTMRDFAPVSLVVNNTTVLVASPSLPANSAKDLAAMAKAKPDALAFASTGLGSMPHLALELYQSAAGVKFVHVPYRGAAPALTDLLGGQVQIMFDTMPAAIGYVRAGQLRALAVTTAMRSEALPDIPTVGEYVPGYEASSLYGIAAPNNTPAEIVDKLNREINAALADAAMKTRLADLGGIVIAGSPADFGKLIAVETDKWAKVIRTGNIKPQ
jgi:tripartite-type tricarboxylate transporter receptor subunit TctC